MNHLGEIRQPVAGWPSLLRQLINKAGTAAISANGSTEAVARAKGEIFEGVDMAGGRDPQQRRCICDFWRGLAKPRRVVDFGWKRKAAVSARCELAATGQSGHHRDSEKPVRRTLNVPGLHNVKNALARQLQPNALGIESKPSRRHCGLSRHEKGRLQRKLFPSGAL